MLNRAVQRNLMAKAHQLRPTVMIGQKGITENVHHEMESALTAHELIKVRVTAPTKEDRVAWVKDLALEHQASLVQQIGHIAVFYRKKPETAKPKASAVTKPQTQAQAKMKARALAQIKAKAKYQAKKIKAKALD